MLNNCLLSRRFNYTCFFILKQLFFIVFSLKKALCYFSYNRHFLAKAVLILKKQAFFKTKRKINRRPHFSFVIDLFTKHSV